MIMIITPPTTPPAIAPICDFFLPELATAGCAVPDVSADDPVAVVGPGELEADEVAVEDPPV